MRIITNVEDANEQNDMNVCHSPSCQDHQHEELNDKIFSNENDAESLLMAKSRFVSVVSRTISNLMTKKGYSRNRATALILQQIRDKNSPPPVDKVFEFMNKYCLGYEESARVLIVSEAFRAASRDKEISSSQAVDELISKLNVITESDRDPTSLHEETLTTNNMYAGSITPSCNSEPANLSPTNHEYQNNNVNNICNMCPMQSNQKTKSNQKSYQTNKKNKNIEFKSETEASLTPSKNYQLSINDRSSRVKKSKLNSLCLVDNHLPTENKIIKTKPSPASITKRKRERSQQQIDGTDSEVPLTVKRHRP